MLSHQACRVPLDGKKLTVAERCGINRLFTNIVVGFCLMQERKVCLW